MRYYESPGWRLRFPLLDIRKIPRPDRSGVLAVLLVYAALTTYFDVVNLKYATAGFPSVYCYLFPWGCGGPPPEDSWHEIRKHYHVVLLSPFPSKAKKAICTCHVDTQYKGMISHHHLEEELTCDSDRSYYTEPREWEIVPGTYTWWFWTNPGHYEPVKLDVFRWHCE
jgi:hypothetical protein